MKSSGISIGFGGLLCLVFITLKLTNQIDWGWLWVLSPLWIPIAIGLAIIILYFLIKDRIEAKSKTHISSTKPSKFRERLEQMEKERKNKL